MPTTTLTFLFTDIAGSSRLWQDYPAAMGAALARHDALLHTAVTSHQGRVVKSTGDGLYAVFESAQAAVLAAVAAQQALHAEAWAETGPLRVRMGLHSGEAQARDGDFFGTAVNRAARLMSAGHGDQILISRTTTGLLGDDLPPGLSLSDLGRHQLKDLRRPVHIMQVDAPGLPQRFPPLRTETRAAPHNLPEAFSSFIGRDRERAAVHADLDPAGTVRLLTLTGTGGTGKTRLALEAAFGRLDAYPDGVWLVELAPVSEPSDVAAALLAALSLGNSGDSVAADALTSYLRPRRALLLLDNCEHLLAACASLAEHLLTTCPGLRILATSREPLGLPGEQVFQVPSLGLPRQDAVSAADLADSEAVRLFVARAAAAQADFRLDDDNAPAVAQIARRLDGIPLALELAAARVSFLTPAQLVTRLDDRFRLLTGGSRSALPRQKTLRALVDWSYDLLDEDEAALLRRLAVFVGGWSLEDAEAVAADLDVLLLLPQLVNKSLVMLDDAQHGRRYFLLETIRRYSLEKLLAAGEAEAARDDHLAYFSDQVAARLADPDNLFGQGQDWYEATRAQEDNYRTALIWGLDRNPVAALTIAAGLGMFWLRRGFAQQWTEWLLQAWDAAQNADVPPYVRSTAQLTLAQLHQTLGHSQVAVEHARHSVALLEDAGRPAEHAFAQGYLGFILTMSGQFQDAKPALDRAVALGEAAGSSAALALAHGSRAALLAYGDGDPQRAAAEAEIGLQHSRNFGTLWVQQMGMLTLVRVATFLPHDVAEIHALFQPLIAGFAGSGDRYFTLVARSEYAHSLRAAGADEDALRAYQHTLVGWRDLGQRAAVAHQLESVAAIALARGQVARAGSLLGAAERIRAEAQADMLPHERITYDHMVDELRTALASPEFEQVWAQGRAMDIDTAVAVAVAAAIELAP